MSHGTGLVAPSTAIMRAPPANGAQSGARPPAVADCTDGPGGASSTDEEAVRVEITLTGDVSLRRGDGPPAAVTGPPRIVLAALVLADGAPVPRDELAARVWPERMPRTWASALRTHVSRVRALLAPVVGGGETVVAGESGYQLVLPERVEAVVDVRRAEAALAAARERFADDPGAALTLAVEAADAIRAPFLPGHPGPWAEAVRAHVEDVAVGALELASAAAAALGDGSRAIALADDAVRRAPLRESAHRRLMTALGATGNRAEALRTYQRLRRVLADELGVDPSPETEAAYLDLLGPAPPRPAGGAAPAGPGGPARGPATVPFVGRRAELAVLAEAWAQAAGGARHLVVVTGEAGIGKSRLATEAARRVHEDGGLVLFGRCDEDAIVPYQPFAEALDALVAATPPDELPLDDEARAELAAVLPSLAGPRRPGAPDRARLFAAVTELVAALAKERPLLLVLDDLQWADDDSLLLVRHLLRRAGDAPVLVVAISRDHDVAPDHALAGVVQSLDRDGWVRRLPLRGLAEDEVRELLRHVLGEGDHRDTARRLVRETAGNPYMVTELARAGADGAIPPGLHELVGLRLAALDEPAAELLRAGAVAGAAFDLDIAADAAGLDDRAMLDAADAALASGLVAEETPDRYRFTHDVVRRALVAQLSGAHRRWLHGRTADAIERRRSGDLDAHAAALAHHSAAGATPGGDDRAVRWARRAAAQAMRRSAPAEAARLCRQALEHLPPGRDGERADITTDLGAALLAGGDPAGVGSLREGAALARAAGRSDVLQRAALALADAAEDRPELRAAASDLVADALAAASPVGDGEGAVTHARLLVRSIRLGAAPSGGATARAAAAAATTLHRHIGDLAPDQVDERLRLVGELAELAVAAGDARLRARAAHERAMAAATTGDEVALRTALAAMEADGDPDDGWLAALRAERRVAELTVDGRLDEARAALDAPRPAGAPDDAELVARRQRGGIEWLAGRVTARELAADDADGPPDLHGLALRALAAVEEGAGAAAAAARARLAPFADLVCGMGYRTFVGAAGFHLGRLAAAEGDLAEAERHLHAALRVHSAWRARPWVALTQSALADVLEARGRPSDREWIAGLRAEARWVAERLGIRT